MVESTPQPTLLEPVDQQTQPGTGQPNATQLQTDHSASAKRKEKGYFKPTVMAALIISNEFYENCRGKPYTGTDEKAKKAHEELEKKKNHHPGWSDVGPAHHDAEFYVQFLTDTVGVPSENITWLQDTNLRDTQAELKKLKKYFQAAKADKDKGFLLFVCYGGHGVMKNENYIVFNDKVNKKRFLDLEYRINAMAEDHGNCCVVVNLDCCRENITQDQMKDVEKPPTEDLKTKGGLARGDDVHILDVQAGVNTISIYGCKPGFGVPIDSKLVQGFVDCVCDSIQANKGLIKLPHALNDISNYQPGSLIQACCQEQILIEPVDYIPYPDDSDIEGQAAYLAALQEKLADAKIQKPLNSRYNKVASSVYDLSIKPNHTMKYRLVPEDPNWFVSKASNPHRLDFQVPTKEGLMSYAEPYKKYQWVPMFKSVLTSEEDMYPDGSFWEFGMSNDENVNFRGKQSTTMPMESLIRNQNITRIRRIILTADRKMLRGIFYYPLDREQVKIGSLGDLNPGWFKRFFQTKVEFELAPNEYIMGCKGKILDQNFQFCSQFQFIIGTIVPMGGEEDKRQPNFWEITKPHDPMNDPQSFVYL